LRDNDVVRVIDLLVVKKNDDGEVEVMQRSDLTTDEARDAQGAREPVEAGKR
jgi:hypothetical protein